MEDLLPTNQEIVDYYINTLMMPRFIPAGQEYVCRTAKDYLYIEVDTFIDHDFEKCVMLDVRTNLDGVEMRDKIFIAYRWTSYYYKRRNVPLPYYCEHGCTSGPCEHAEEQNKKYAAEYQWLADMMAKHVFKLS